MREIELWWRRAVDADLLSPLQGLEPTLAALFRLVRKQATRPYEAPLPVVSIGSPLLGGSGKTPLTSWVAQVLSQRLQVAIVSRGYRRHSTGQQLVSDGQGVVASVETAGDELRMLARRIPQAIVLADANRSQAIRRATELGAQVVCLDDALQNQSVRKDLNLVVLHQDEALQAPRLFPLGRLRIPLPEIANADALIVVCPSGTSLDQMRQVQRPVWLPADLPVVAARLRHAGFWDAYQHSPVQIQVGQRVAAWASIAAPRRFFASLAQEGLVVTEGRAEPDHHRPDPGALQAWAIRQRHCGACYLCCTEKDAMHPLPSLCLPVVYLRIELEFPLGNEPLTRLLEERVHDRIASSRSPHIDSPESAASTCAPDGTISAPGD